MSNFELRANSSGFTSEMSKAERSLERMDQVQKGAIKSAKRYGAETETAIDKLKKGFGGLGSIVAGLGVGLAFNKMVENTSRQDAALAQLNATLASTEGAAGKTAAELIATASSLQKVTAYGDEAIIEAQSLIATFKEVKGDQFDEATVAVLDMATALKTDLKSASIQIGKALNDPAGQLTALSRAGIIFNDTQKEMIRTMAEAGDVAGAQAIILEELRGEFGGSAEAYRQTLGGALEGLSNAWGDLFEAESSASSSMVEGLNSIEAAITAPGFKDGINLIVTGMTEMFGKMVDIAGLANDFGESVAGGINHARVEWGWFRDSLDEAGEALTATVDVSSEVIAARQAERAATDQTTTAVEGKTKATLKEIEVSATRNKLSQDAIKSIKANETALAKLRKEQEKQAAQLKKNLESNGAIIEAIERETLYLGLSEEAIELDTEMRKLNADATDEQIQAFGAAVAARRLAQIEAKKNTEAVKAEADAQEDAAGRTEEAWQGGLAEIGSLFTSFLDDGKVSFDGLADYFSDTLAKMVSEAAATSIPIPGGAFGAGILGGFAGAAAQSIIPKVLDAIGLGEDNDGDNRGLASFDLSSGTSSSRGVGTSFDSGNVSTAEALVDSVETLAKLVGGSNYSGNISVGTNSGIQIDGQGFGNDEDDAFAFLFQKTVEGAKDLSDGLRELLLGFEGSSEQLDLFVRSILSMRDNAGVDSIALAIDDWNNAQRTLLQTYNDSTGSLDTLIQNFDGSAASAEELALAFADNKQAAYDYAIAIQSIGAAMEESAERQARSIRESVMAEGDLLAAREEERDALRESLSSLTDPQEIEEAGNRILELNKKIFDSLSENEQKRRAEEFAGIAENTATVAQEVLDRSLETLQEASQDVNERIRFMLEGAAARQQQAADTALQAAQTMLQAARTTQTIVVELPAAGEVNS